MKRIMCFLILVIGWLGLSGQNQKPDNKGAWFIFEDQNYNITIDDIVEISMGAEKMIAWESYHLSNRENFIPVNPQLWFEVMTELITEIDGVKPVNLADSISEHGVIVNWNDDISGSVINYGLDRKGKKFDADANFKGTDGFKGLNYKGYLILKVSKPCLNPLRPQISIPVPKAKKIVAEQQSKLDSTLSQKLAALDKKIEEANNRLNEVEETEKKDESSFEDIVYVDDEKTPFFKRRGIKIGGIVIGAGGIATILYAILHKDSHGSMSGGREGADGKTSTTEGSGGRVD